MFLATLFLPDDIYSHAFIAEKSGDSWLMKDIHPETIYRYPEADGTASGLNSSSAVDINDSAQTIITRSSSSIEFDITVAYKSNTDWSFVTLEDAFTTPLKVKLSGEDVFINDTGQITFSFFGDTRNASRLKATSVHYSESSWHRDDLPFIEADHFMIRGTNNLNQITGNKNDGLPRPFVATLGENGWAVKYFLDNTDEFGIGRSYDINDSGIVTGYKYRFSHNNDGAFVYIDGKIHLLKDLIVNGIEGWEGVNTDAPKKINNSGQIIGNGTYNGKEMAFLLTPLPETVKWG